MKETRLALPYVGLIAGTRVALGIGIGLLASRRFRETVRRRAGWALLTIGALSTIPLGVQIVSGVRRAEAT